MLPDGAHLRPADWTIFFLNQAKPAPWNGNKALTESTENPLLYVLNLVRTNHDASIRRYISWDILPSFVSMADGYSPSLLQVN